MWIRIHKVAENGSDWIEILHTDSNRYRYCRKRYRDNVKKEIEREREKVSETGKKRIPVHELLYIEFGKSRD